VLAVVTILLVVAAGACPLHDECATDGLPCIASPATIPAVVAPILPLPDRFAGELPSAGDSVRPDVPVPPPEA
jgi:hypothetical protein